jgi:hypothetical protein
MNMPDVRTKFVQMRGGLDTSSAATLVKEGFLIDSQNYEQDAINGGYARVSGYERFDGRTEPSSARYWTLPTAITGAIVAGNTVTGQTSTATGRVLYVGAGLLVLGRVTGTFQSSENLTVSAVVQGVTTATATLSGATTSADDAAYLSLAANDRRQDIAAVPGAGAILGVWMYNDTVYAWRNNVGNTAAVLHKSTASGWSAVPMFKEIAFSTGLVKTKVGEVLYGTTSGATGTVKRVVTRTGSWGSTATGYVVIDVTSGTFNGTETLKLTNGAGAVQMTSTSTANLIAFAPSGRFEFANYNFTASTATFRMYGCDGVNPAFEFDGTTLAFIRTGMTEDKPSHIAAHANYLFLSFKSSIQNSGIGDPYSWSILTGASEIGLGDDITALLALPGDSTNTALAIFTKNSTKTLYGKSAASWQLSTSSPTTGGYAGTAQYLGSAFVLSERGIQSISASQQFGDFEFATASTQVKQHINRLKNLSLCSTVYKERNQYRIFFSNGVALSLSMIGGKTAGIMLHYTPTMVRCVVTDENADGNEYSYFGSDDGFVYRDNVGSSFDGEEIEAWLRLPFHHFGSPRHLKTFRRITLDMVASGYTGFSVSHELAGGEFSVDSGVIAPYETNGRGGYWDQFQWDDFNWDSPSVLSPVFDLCGTERNISIIFYSNSAIYASHSVQGAHFDFTIRRLAR